MRSDIVLTKISALRTDKTPPTKGNAWENLLLVPSPTPHQGDKFDAIGAAQKFSVQSPHNDADGTAGQSLKISPYFVEPCVLGPFTDVVSPAAGLQTMPYATSDFDKGVRINGSENQRGNISVGSMLSESVQSSRATSEGSSQASSKQFTSTMGRSLDN